MLFRKAYSVLPRDCPLKLDGFLHQILTEHWRSSAHRQSVGFAADILANLTTGSFSDFGFANSLESELAKREPGSVATADPLTYWAMRNGSEASFVKTLSE